MNESEKMKVLGLLNGTKDLLIEKGWTQGAFARDTYGERVPVRDPNACTFCLLGALNRTAETHGLVEGGAKQQALMALWTAKGTATGIAAYNDQPVRTKEGILALIDRAKELVTNGQD